MGELSEVCSQTVLKCLYLARTGRPEPNLQDRSQSGPKLVTNALARLISHIHHASEFKQYCHVGNTTQQCGLGLFQDSHFVRRLGRFKINIRRTLVHFRKSHVRANKLDVQETDIGLTQLNRS